MSDTDTDDTTTTRRTVLKLSGVAGLLATGALAAGQSAGEDDLFVGGDADAGFRHGVWSFAPASFPPDDPQVAHARRDAPGAQGTTYETTPAQWTASGIRWSIAGDLATAKGNASEYPAVALDPDGAEALLWEASLPIQWSADGVEHVIATDLTSARSTHSGAQPAVLWGESGEREVVFDA